MAVAADASGLAPGGDGRAVRRALGGEPRRIQHRRFGDLETVDHMYTRLQRPQISWKLMSLAVAE
jgi:hypothetical protein